jgi:hypothetical protein
MFSTRLSKENLTHEELLLVLPFECGYTCTEDGKPDWDSIVTAISLISIDAIMNPHNVYTPQIN